jgi:hypothetical protein
VPISALAFHGITTQVPRVVHLAVPGDDMRACASVRLRYKSVQIYRFDLPTFGQGIEVHAIDRVPVRIYGVARTLVDCFKSADVNSAHDWGSTITRVLFFALSYQGACRFRLFLMLCHADGGV